MEASLHTMTTWAEAYAAAWGELVDGQHDVHDTLDDAYELYPAHGKHDPCEVAAQQHAAMMARLDRPGVE